MTYMEYEEVKVPDNIVAKIEEAREKGEVMTLGDAGVFEWLNKLSREDGWRVVWQGFNFPYLVLEREVVVEEV